MLAAHCCCHSLSTLLSSPLIPHLSAQLIILLRYMDNVDVSHTKPMSASTEHRYSCQACAYCLLLVSSAPCPSIAACALPLSLPSSLQCSHLSTDINTLNDFGKHRHATGNNHALQLYSNQQHEYAVVRRQS